MLRAKDVMTKAVLTVSPGDSLATAMEIIVEHGISGLPVVDHHGRLVGIISEFDGLKMLDDPACRHAHVADHMSHGVITVEEHATLNQVADLMVRVALRRLPVVSAGKVVGIVSRRDLVRALEENETVAQTSLPEKRNSSGSDM